MAEDNTYWINMDEATLNWAKEKYALHKLQNAIERRLVNYTISSERRSAFQEALNKVKTAAAPGCVVGALFPQRGGRGRGIALPRARERSFFIHEVRNKNANLKIKTQ